MKLVQFTLLLVLLIPGNVYSRRKNWRCILSARLESSRHSSPVMKCGVAPLESKGHYLKRIVGGTNARQDSHPWVVRLSWPDDTFACGGTLISEFFVLTAAHCVLGRNQSALTLILGDHDQFEDNEVQHLERKACVIVHHPRYNKIRRDSDIALVKMCTPVPFQDNIQPACFPSSGNNGDPPVRSAWAMGWGQAGSKDFFEVPPYLQKIKLRMMSSLTCQRKMELKITKNMLCASSKYGGICRGDSGGPLLVKRNRLWQLYGIASWGRGCFEHKYPMVFTKVTNYVDWIKNEMHKLMQQELSAEG